MRGPFWGVTTRTVPKRMTNPSQRKGNDKRPLFGENPPAPKKKNPRRGGDLQGDGYEPNSVRFPHWQEPTGWVERGSQAGQWNEKNPGNRWWPRSLADLAKIRKVQGRRKPDGPELRCATAGGTCLREGVGVDKRRKPESDVQPKCSVWGKKPKPTGES